MVRTPTVSQQVLEATWTRNLFQLRESPIMKGNTDVSARESIVFTTYHDFLLKVDELRLAGIYKLQQCPSDDAWESPPRCEEPSSVVSMYCMKHAALFDENQPFFTDCSRCKEKKQLGDGRRNVALYYHKLTNLCFEHQAGVRRRVRKNSYMQQKDEEFWLELQRQQQDFVELILREIQHTGDVLKDSPIPDVAEERPCFTMEELEAAEGFQEPPVYWNNDSRMCFCKNVDPDDWKDIDPLLEMSISGEEFCAALGDIWATEVEIDDELMETVKDVNDFLENDGIRSEDNEGGEMQETIDLDGEFDWRMAAVEEMDRRSPLPD